MFAHLSESIFCSRNVQFRRCRMLLGAAQIRRRFLSAASGRNQLIIRGFELVKIWPPAS